MPLTLSDKEVNTLIKLIDECDSPDAATNALITIRDMLRKHNFMKQ